MANTDSTLVKFRCRVSYVNLASPAKPMEGQETDVPKFRLECRIPKGDESLVAIRKAMKEAWLKKFGTDVKQWKALFREPNFFENHLSIDGKDGFFLRDGKYHSGDSEGYVDEVYFSASNKNRPVCGKLVKGGWKRLVDEDEIRDVIYSGCYCYVVIQCYAYDNKAAKAQGLGASVQAVVFAEDGDRLSGSRVSDKDMNDMFGEESDPEASDEDMIV